MQETKDTSLFTEITAEESASVNGAHYYSSRYDRYARRGRGCNNYSYNPYFEAAQLVATSTTRRIVATTTTKKLHRNTNKFWVCKFRLQNLINAL